MTFDAEQTLEILNKADLSNAFGQAASQNQIGKESLASAFTNAVNYVDNTPEIKEPIVQGPKNDTGFSL